VCVCAIEEGYIQRLYTKWKVKVRKKCKGVVVLFLREKKKDSKKRQKHLIRIIPYATRVKKKNLTLGLSFHSGRTQPMQNLALQVCRVWNTQRITYTNQSGSLFMRDRYPLVALPSRPHCPPSHLLYLPALLYPSPRC
jgi:hypothetical protein